MKRNPLSLTVEIMINFLIKMQCMGIVEGVTFHFNSHFLTLPQLVLPRFFSQKLPTYHPIGMETFATGHNLGTI